MLERLRKFALDHSGVEIAEVRNGKLFVGFASYADASEFILVDSLQELRDFLGY